MDPQIKTAVQAMVEEVFQAYPEATAINVSWSNGQASISVSVPVAQGNLSVVLNVLMEKPPSV